MKKYEILTKINGFEVATFHFNNDLNIGDVVEISIRNKKQFGIVKKKVSIVDKR